MLIASTGKALRSARAALSRAQRDTQEAFKRYKACLDLEAQAMQQVTSAEERRDSLSTFRISMSGQIGLQCFSGLLDGSLPAGWQ